jgi:hypothetical protein
VSDTTKLNIYSSAKYKSEIIINKNGCENYHSH